MMDIEAQICDRLPKMKAYIMSKCNLREEAEDIYGDMIVRIWKIIRNGGPRGGYSNDGYIWNSAKFAIGDYYRKERKMKRNHDEYGYHLPASMRSFEGEYEASIVFMREIEKLSPVYRKVLILLLFQNMGPNEIADTLRISSNAVSLIPINRRNKRRNHANNK